MYKIFLSKETVRFLVSLDREDEEVMRNRTQV